MSAPGKQPPSALVAAATAVDAELQRFEEVSRLVQRTGLDSEKNLARAANRLQQAAETEERLGACVNALVSAIASARDRQIVQSQSVQRRALEIEARTKLRQEPLARHAGIGKEAAELNGLMAELAAKSDGDAEKFTVASGLVEQIEERMIRLADEADRLVKAAEADDCSDIAKPAESLRQLLLAAKRRLSLLHQPTAP